MKLCNYFSCDSRNELFHTEKTHRCSTAVMAMMNDRAVTSSWSCSAFTPVVNGRPVVVTSAVTPTTNDLQTLELNREIQPLELNSETFDDSDSSFINDTSTTSSVTTDDPLEPNRENVVNSVPTTDDNVPTIGHGTITLGQIEYGDGGTYWLWHIVLLGRCILSRMLV